MEMPPKSMIVIEFVRHHPNALHIVDPFMHMGEEEK